ncbi:MAG: acyltransferase [Rhodospirillales bacterium]|nr:acyltransferase [Rhodospirillales bacterium]
MVQRPADGDGTCKQRLASRLANTSGITVPEGTDMQPGDRSIQPNRFIALDGWRGIIACIIALCHLNVYSHIYGATILQHAYIFVDFFFVLSGFVITYSYIDRITNAPQLATFIGKRFSRIWPLHIIMLAAFIGCEILKLFMLSKTGISTETAPFEGNNTLSSIIPNVFLIHSIGIFDNYTWNIPSWALSVEFYTYIVFSIIAFLSGHTRVREQAIMGMMIATSAISYFVILRYSSRGIDTDVEYGIFRCLLDFSIGYFLYKIWKYANHRTAFRDCGILLFSTLEICTLLIFFYYIHFAGNTPFANLAPFVVAFTIFMFAIERGALSRILGSAFLQRLGHYSFCIYIIHLFVAINVIDRPAQIIAKVFSLDILRPASSLPIKGISETGNVIVLPNEWYGDFITIFYIGIVIVLSGLAFKYIEIPFSRTLNGFFQKASSAAKPVQRAVGAYSENG